MGVDFRIGIWHAVLEAASTQHFALYTYTDKERFVRVGSVVYAIIFIVGIPIFFFAIDKPSDNPRATAQPRKWTTVYEVRTEFTGGNCDSEVAARFVANVSR